MTKIGIIRGCVFCGNEYEVKVDVADLEKYNNGALAQVAFPLPKYTIEDREFMISSICPCCQAKIFA